MTARRIVVIACDHDGCTERFTVADEKIFPTRDAATAEGWRCETYRTSERRWGVRDLCTTHARMLERVAGA